MLSLLKKEVTSFLGSLIGYVVIIVFLVTVSLFLWVFPATDSNILENGYASLDSLFTISPWVFMFLIPAITMRSLAEEKKSGTIELLLTRPLTEFQIVFAKYLAGMVLVIISLLPTLLYFLSISLLSVPAGNVDTGSTWGSYIGLVFLSSGFVAIGIFSSSLTDNQVIAFIVAVFLSFLCYTGFESLSSLALFGKVDIIIQQLGINAHYLSMSRGVIDTRDAIYFISLTTLFLFITKTSLQSRKW